MILWGGHFNNIQTFTGALGSVKGEGFIYILKQLGKLRRNTFSQGDVIRILSAREGGGFVVHRELVYSTKASPEGIPHRLEGATSEHHLPEASL